LKRYLRLLFVVLMLLAATSAFADCSYFTVVEWQVTYWWDGEITYTILSITEYSYCTVGGDPLPPDPPGGGFVPPPMPGVSLSNVDTTDIYNPVVSIDVTSNDPSDPVTTVLLELNGQTVDYGSFGGNGTYQMHLQSIPSFQDGSYTLNAKACSGTGNCGQNSATLTRFTPSPATDGKDMNVAWHEEEESGPVTRFANYTHNLRQAYTTTTFSCPETGQNSHVQTKESLVTIAGNDPMPMWTAGATTAGTINDTVYGIYDASENPVNCTFPTLCDSKIGNPGGGSFGYAPSVHEGLWSFVVDGQNASFTGGSLDVWFP